MLAPALPGAILTLATLTGKAPAVLTRALPAFGARYLPDPVRATTACRRCLAIRGIYQPVPVHRPAHHLICSRHGQWLSAAGQPQLDLTESPEIVIACQRSHKLLRRCTPQQLMIALLAAERTLRGPGPPAGAPRQQPFVTALAAPAAPAQDHQPAPGRPPRRGTHPRSDLPRRHRPSRAPLNLAAHARSSKIHWRTHRSHPARTSHDPGPVRHRRFLTPGQTTRRGRSSVTGQPGAGGGTQGGLHDGKEGFPGVGIGGYHHGDRPGEDAEEDLQAR